MEAFESYLMLATLTFSTQRDELVAFGVVLAVVIGLSTVLEGWARGALQGAIRAAQVPLCMMGFAVIVATQLVVASI